MEMPTHSTRPKKNEEMWRGDSKRISQVFAATARYANFSGLVKNGIMKEI